jgi:hypothetical protein
MKFKIRHIPTRVATGAFILSSGLAKRKAGEENAVQLHGLTAGTYPIAAKLSPPAFLQFVSTGEIALGTALLLPIVPTALAGAGLTAFSAGLLGLYLKTPGMHEPGSLAPTQQGTPIAKDVWMLGIGVGLMIDALGESVRSK